MEQQNKAPALQAEATGAWEHIRVSASNVPGTDVISNSERSLEFLRRFAPEGPWSLVAIDPDPKKGRHLQGATFTADRAEACREWIDEHNGRFNLYFHVNPLIRTPKPKARKEEVAAVCWLHVDIDPRAEENIAEEQKRIETRLSGQLPAGVPAPTCIVFSGGGYQAFWRLRDPVQVDGDVARSTEAERYNRELERILGGDNCHNVDRVMRLPGTKNIPDERKRKRGRKEAFAHVVEFNDNAYDLSDFTPASPVMPNDEGAHAGPCKAKSIDDVNELDQWRVPDRVKIAIVQGKHSDQPKEGDNSRSSWLFDVCCNLIRCGVPEDIILGVITDPCFGISESILELRSRAERYARRQIERAKEACGDFDRNASGKPLTSIRNLRIALARMGVNVRRNAFGDRYAIFGLKGYGPEFNDSAERALRVGIEEKFALVFRKDRFADLVLRDADEESFHPVKDYLAGLRWDGNARCESWLIDLAGAEDSLYVREVSRIVLVAAIRRIMQPGCKYDELLILEGPQGGGKSTALKHLAVEEEWFTDNLPLSGESKIAIEQTQGKWIAEAAELKGKGRDIDALKNFLSMPTDRARLAYGRLAQDFPRQWIAIGTTNKGEYLHDPTGNRRFWPVAVQSFDLGKMTRSYVDQLWAEAVTLEAEGGSIRLDPALYETAAAEQSKREEVDPWQETIEELIRERVGDVFGCRVSAHELWNRVNVGVEHRSQKDNMRLGAIMRKLGFKRQSVKIYKKTKNGYVRGDGSAVVDAPPSPF